MNYETLESRPTIDGRYQLTREEWKKTHRDFRGGSTRDNTASILCLVPGSGTCLVPVHVVPKVLTQQGALLALIAKLKKSLKERAQLAAAQQRVALARMQQEGLDALTKGLDGDEAAGGRGFGPDRFPRA